MLVARTFFFFLPRETAGGMSHEKRFTLAQTRPLRNTRGALVDVVLEEGRLEVRVTSSRAFRDREPR